jgi:hypothetical protein
MIVAAKEGIVPLSDHEQRLLDEIEQALYADDPKFVSSVRSVRSRAGHRRTIIMCILGVLLGLGLVLIGLVVTLIPLSVGGFVLVVAACGYGVQALRRRPGAPAERSHAGQAPRSAGLRTRMEERLRRRFDQD